MYLDLIDSYTEVLSDLDTKITEALSLSLTAARELLCSIPGWSTTVAEIFLAETGGDMTVFATAGHLASWAGVCPGVNESAGRVKSTKTRNGNRNLKRCSRHRRPVGYTLQGHLLRRQIPPHLRATRTDESPCGG